MRIIWLTVYILFYILHIVGSEKFLNKMWYKKAEKAKTRVKMTCLKNFHTERGEYTHGSQEKSSTEEKRKKEIVLIKNGVTSYKVGLMKISPTLYFKASGPQS
jgi:hypothetical protein